MYNLLLLGFLSSNLNDLHTVAEKSPKHFSFNWKFTVTVRHGLCCLIKNLLLFCLYFARVGL